MYIYICLSLSHSLCFHMLADCRSAPRPSDARPTWTQNVQTAGGGPRGWENAALSIGCTLGHSLARSAVPRHSNHRKWRETQPKRTSVTQVAR